MPSPELAAPTVIVLPVKAMRDRIVKLILAAVPGLNLKVADSFDELRDDLENVEVILTFGQFLTDEAVAKAKRLRFIQALGSGVDGILDRTGLSPEVMIASARGAHRDCVSEAAFALMLAVARDLPRLVRAQQDRKWAPAPSRLLKGKTVGILGVGVIAEGLAERCKAFGMSVVGVSSRTSAPGFDLMVRRSELAKAAGSFDYLVLLAPLEEGSRHIVNREVLQAMKPSSVLVNVARGGIVDENALLEALRNGPIAAAALDVFEQEPLPPDHAFWTEPNVLISPHTGGQHDEYAESIMPFVGSNLRAYFAGHERALVNRVR